MTTPYQESLDSVYSSLSKMPTYSLQAIRYSLRREVWIDSLRRYSTPWNLRALNIDLMRITDRILLERTLS